MRIGYTVQGAPTKVTQQITPRLTSQAHVICALTGCDGPGLVVGVCFRMMSAVQAGHCAEPFVASAKPGATRRLKTSAASRRRPLWKQTTTSVLLSPGPCTQLRADISTKSNVRLRVLAALVPFLLTSPGVARDSAGWRSAGVEVSNAPHAFGANCRSKLTVTGFTTVASARAGRAAIEAWSQEVRATYGSAFEDFTRAKEPIVRCRQFGNNPEQGCAASGFPRK